MDNLLNQPFPPLRQDLEMMPATKDGQPLIVLSDVLGLDLQSVVVSPPVVMVASLFDGKKKAADIRAELVQQKIILTEAEIQNIADQLNQFGLLETTKTQELRRERLDRFQKSPVRHFIPAQRGLPENQLDFSMLLGKFYEDPKGPGPVISMKDFTAPPLGVVAPHIDFFRGGPLYAWSYGELAKRQPPDLIVSLGVAHLSPRSPWVMTKKSYATPYGPVEVDESLYEDIRRKLWYDPLEEEWVHAKEHSLEFQALWLKYIWRDKTPKWVPLLCSSFERYAQDKSPASVESVEKALTDIGALLAERAKKGQRIMILAGVDLAHVGPKFGDDMEVTDELKKKIEDLDRASLENALKLDSDKFFLAGVGDGAWRKVCGLSALYTSLRWMKALNNDSPLQGKLLAYDQQPDPAGGIVSFCSAIYDK